VHDRKASSRVRARARNRSQSRLRAGAAFPLTSPGDARLHPRSTRQRTARPLRLRREGHHRRRGGRHAPQRPPRLERLLPRVRSSPVRDPPPGPPGRTGRV
jgi:hypothetical protein